ncbi:hypothetical protein GOP47_0000459 [Adiantum capillus-veneris]|uniref:Geranylgeranyl transferase type-2 subunit alpha n=1 Tax=Adiantum capillus-veneris TaxID=13818 RepID=A0A9D4VDZ8_ADICA|nr:hypothetical protein GOP47_0000459 [Adiantum capillus-veneris]
MHGRPRTIQAPDPARQRHEEAKTANFQALLEQVLHNHRDRNFSKEALLQNAKLLEANPEVYTAWNYRKLAVTHLLDSLQDEAARKSVLDNELLVIERALMRNFKSYGAWHHRKWILQFGLSSLDHEYRLLDKLLTSDARNFHGWAYRRFLAKIKKATEEHELQYTIKKINENFSNYSAWHSRSVLLSKQFLANAIERNTWLKALTEEYDLVKQAFFTEPEDQSGWFYLVWLLSQTVIPSRPLLAGFWPPNGSSVALNLDAPCRTRYSVVLCFSVPVCGVNTETVSVRFSSKVQISEFGLSWICVPDNSNSSKVWIADLADSCKSLDAGTFLTLDVEIGARPGIISEDGPLVGVQQFNFNLEVRSSSVPGCGEHDVLDACVAWPGECKQGFSRCEQSMGTVLDGPVVQCERHLEPLSDWKMETLKAQIDTCRELLDLEEDSKWGMLMLARLLVAHNQLASSHSPHTDEIQQLYKRLMKVDPTHGHYYDEQSSSLLFSQITSSLHNLSVHCWKSQQSNGDQELWLRVNNLSLSKLGYFEKLIWVQNLDLRNNKLHSLEGIEALQFLINLDVSHNQLSSITALQPISFLPKLQALNMKWNEIGSHPTDTNRYLFPTALSNSPESISIKIVKHQKGPLYWEVYEVFSRMRLRQLDIYGNPVSTSEFFRSQLIEALPCLLWLDGVHVSWGFSKLLCNAGALFVPIPRVDLTDRLHSQIQELKVENEELKARLAALEARLSSLESQKQADKEHLLAKSKVVEYTLTASVANLATQVQKATIAVSSKVEECMQECRRKGLALCLNWWLALYLVGRVR